MILSLSILSWVVLLAIAHLVLRQAVFRSRAGMRTNGALLICALVVFALFMRPEEEIEIGEDPGVYFHSAASLVQHKAFRFPDPALALLAPGERLLFRYGDANFKITKDNALWARTHEMHEVGNHFMAGFALLLGLPIALGFPYGVFGVTPLFGVLAGLLVFRLGLIVTGNRCGGWAAFLLYLLNPVVFWNARCLRAEMPAAFLVLAGMVLWLEAERESPAPPLRAFAAGFSLALASLYHVTAIYVLLPAVVVGIWNTRKTRFWYYWWVGLVSGLALFAIHLMWISDPYGILSNLLKPGRRFPLLVVGLFLGGFIRALKWVQVSFQKRVGRYSRIGLTCWWGALAIGCIAVVLYTLRYRLPDGRLPGFAPWTAGYLSLTDFEAVYRILSRLFVLVGVVGFLPLCLRSSASIGEKRQLFILLAPAALTIGWTDNFMFETRRMLPFLTPLLVFGIVAIIQQLVDAGLWIKTRTGLRLPAAVVPGIYAVAVIVLLLAGYRGRSHLYTTWNYAGAFGFYRNIAADVCDAGELLLGEYTQTTAPVERLSGVPALPIAWGYRTEAQYREIESIYARLVEQAPDKPILFMTPFSGAALPGLALQPLQQYQLRSRRVDRAARDVPRGTHPFDRTIRLYRVLPEDRTGAILPYTRIMDGSLLGLRGAANLMHNRSISLAGVALQAGDVWLPTKGASNRAFYIFARLDDDGRIDFAPSAGGISFQRWDLERWTIVQVAGMPEDASVRVQVQGSVFLVDVFAVCHEANVTRVALEGTEAFTMAGVHSQWTLDQAGLALPSIGEADASRFLFLLATTGRDDGADVRVRISGHGAWQEIQAQQGWHWHVIPLRIEDTSGVFTWYNVTTSPAWDPQIGGFPGRLGLRIAAVMLQ